MGWVALRWVGYGRLGWVFDFSIGGSFTFKGWAGWFWLGGVELGWVASGSVALGRVW